MCVSQIYVTQKITCFYGKPKKLGTVTIKSFVGWKIHLECFGGTSGHQHHPSGHTRTGFRESEPSGPAECWWHEPREDLVLYTIRIYIYIERERDMYIVLILYIYDVHVYYAVCKWES